MHSRSQMIIAILFVQFVLFSNCKGRVDQDKMENGTLVQVYFPEFKITVVPERCDTEKVVELINTKSKLKIQFEDCRGAMRFKEFDSAGNLVSDGVYINSIDTLKRYSTSKSAIDNSRSISVTKYFQPLPHGIWNYYKADSIIRTEEYSFGILIEK